MKVKKVVIILILIIIIVPFANIVLADYFNNSGKSEIAEKLYDYYLKLPNAFRKDEALYKKSETTMNGFGRYSIMMRTQGGEKQLDYIAINKAIDNYEKIIEKYPKGSYYPLAYKGILDSYIYLGDSNNLEKWISWGKNIVNKEIRDISILYEGYDYFVNREYSKAEEVLETFVLENKDLDNIYYFLKGHIEFAKEDFTKTMEYYNIASEIGWRYGTGFFGSVVSYGRKDWLEELDFKEGEYKIKGRVTADGVGIPYVEVYLQKPRQGFSSHGIDFIAITDKEGYYETIGVKEGKYDLGIGIGTGVLSEKAYLDKGLYNIEIPFDMEYDFEFKTPIKIISPKPNEVIKENKFEIEWEEVEGAEYYKVESVEVNGGAVMIVPIRDENRQLELKGNKAIFDIEIIKNSPIGYSIDENGVVDPAAIIGYLYEEKTTPIIVNAYDKNGYMLGSSVPMAKRHNNESGIIIEGELTEGEKLIVNKEYKKTIDYYEELLLKEEDNVEALSYLSKLYIFGWGKGTKDSEKALLYGRRAYDIEKDSDLILGIIGQMDSKDYRENKEDINVIFDIIPKEYRDTYFYWYRGEYYMALGEFENAREDLVLTNHISDSDIIYIDLYYDEYTRSIGFLKDENTRLYSMSKGKLMDGIELIKDLDEDNKDLILFKEFLARCLKRELDYEEGKDDFYRVYYNIKDPGIRIILNEIKADNYWD